MNWAQCYLFFGSNADFRSPIRCQLGLLVCWHLNPCCAINYSLSLGLHMRRLIWWKWRARHTMFSCFFFISFSFDLRWYSCYLFLFLSHSFSSFCSRHWFCFLPLLVFSFSFVNLLYYFFSLITYLIFLLNFVDVFFSIS